MRDGASNYGLSFCKPSAGKADAGVFAAAIGSAFGSPHQGQRAYLGFYVLSGDDEHDSLLVQHFCQHKVTSAFACA